MPNPHASSPPAFAPDLPSAFASNLSRAFHVKHGAVSRGYLRLFKGTVSLREAL